MNAFFAGNLLNTFRLGNLKRPAYVPPPALSISSLNNMAAIPDPVLPMTPNPSTLFTPIKDEVNNHKSTASSGFTNQTSTGASPSFLSPAGSAVNAAGDLNTNPKLPSYQSPVSNQGATVLPSTSEPPSLVSFIFVSKILFSLCYRKYALV